LAAPGFFVCKLATAPPWETVIRSGAKRLILLSGDVFACYEPAKSTLTAYGWGSLITITEARDAGSEPAPLIVDVLVPQATEAEQG
jgi:hypothetical protein